MPLWFCCAISDQGFVGAGGGIVDADEGFVDADEGFVNADQAFVTVGQGFVDEDCEIVEVDGGGFVDAGEGSSTQMKQTVAGEAQGLRTHCTAVQAFTPT